MANQEQLDILKQKFTGVKVWNQWRREHSINKPNLSGADLSNANLKGANLYRADLKDARVIEEQLKEAKSLHGATMPDGSKHP
jgi:uncharacterized protein YjbI with pentapeptide repeats